MLTNQEVVIEQEVLSGLFQDNSLLVQAKENIKPNMFYVKNHREIYKAFIKMKNEGYEIDVTNFLEYFKDRTKDFGGVTYVTQISLCLPSQVGYESKLKILVNNYKRHIIKDLIPKIAESDDVDKLIDNVEKTLKSAYECELVENINIASEYEEYLDWLYENSTDRGFKSNLDALDEYLGNFQRGRLITIFARSGVGKSTLAIEIAKNTALQGNKVVYASGEMSRQEVFGKMAASHLTIPYKKIINKQIDDKEKDQIAGFSGLLLNNNFHITNECNIYKLINEIKAYKLQYGLDILVVDYINKYTNSITSGEKLTEKIGMITSALKDLALKENICVILLAQCNRVADKNVGDYMTDKITEADIQDSARIEQDSDQLIALYRNKKLDDVITREKMKKEGKLDYNSKLADKNPFCINIMICKNRHGNRGTLAFRWEGQYSRITNFS